MTKVLVYAGPSVKSQDRKSYPGVAFRPPIEEGDLLKLPLDAPMVIGIIDGYFGDRRAVSHKEILWVMSKGVPVYGAASMGALRAAELDSYGMTGIGDIYEDYRNGKLTDDGEVAVSHGPEELGYPTTTVALVDVRATLRSLVGIGSLSEDEARKAGAVAAKIDFRDRTWATLANRLRGICYDENTWANLLLNGHVERKRLNAVLLLEKLAGAQATDHPPAPFVAPPLSHSFRQDLERSGVEVNWPKPPFKS